MKTRDAIAKDVMAMWTSTVMTQFIGFFLAVFVRRELGPERMGIWALLQVFVGYSTYVGLGIYDAVLREIPICRGQNDHARAKKLGSIAFTFTTVTSLVFSAVCVLYALYFRSTLSAPIFWGALAIAVTVPLQRWSNFLVGFLYIEKQFVLAGRFKTYSAIANALLVLAGVYLFKLYGFYLAMVFSFAWNILYLNRKYPLHLGWQWDGAELKQLLRFSSVLLVIGFLNTFIMSADRLVIGRMLGLEALGQYTLATMGSGFVLMFAHMFSATIYPRVLERYGAKGSSEDVVRTVMLPSLFLSAYLPAAMGLIWAFAPWLTACLLPKYNAGLPALRILLVGTIFLALGTQTNQTLLALKRQRSMLFTYVGCAIAILFIFYAAYARGGTVEAYAAASSFSFFLIFSTQVLLSLHGAAPFTGRALLWVRITLLVSLSACFIFMMDRFWPEVSLMNSMWRLLFFVPAALLASLSVEKRVGLYPVLRDYLRPKTPVTRVAR